MSYKNCMIVTGGTANLGYHTSLNLAKERPDRLIILASRSNNDNAADAINKTLKQNNTLYLPLDLADTSNVRAFAKRWESGLEQPLPPIEALGAQRRAAIPGPSQHDGRGR
ncbi:hypothetical protein O1611_g6302 [Lasiodiplodia mahajangana]|uniref:Uncharacterized protein n=1 Tax=Lasiodiplodia mahajangana TaxID=1108764 RepID=A0ACC2JJC9_9PEZI|nr:hypothetical protein O1611_g6302 [Lasiodiplodia mahajangana]